MGSPIVFSLQNSNCTYLYVEQKGFFLLTFSRFHFLKSWFCKPPLVDHLFKGRQSPAPPISPPSPVGLPCLMKFIHANQEQHLLPLELSLDHLSKLIVKRHTH